MLTPISQSAQDSATELYLGFFGRTPDTAGLSYWASQIASGASVLSVAASFAQTTEFHTQYGGLNAAAQINLIYQDILFFDLFQTNIKLIYLFTIIVVLIIIFNI